MGTQPGCNVSRTHRVYINHNGVDPWPCYGCAELVVKIGRSTWDGNIHHLDHDASNDDPTNLVMMHTVCHQRLHGPPTEDQRRQISEKLRGRPSPTRGMKFPDRKKVNFEGELNPFYGKTHTPKTRAQMSQPRRRIRCEGCDTEYAVNWISRHVREGMCTNS